MARRKQPRLQIIRIKQLDGVVEPCIICGMQGNPTYELSLVIDGEEGVIFRGDAICCNHIVAGVKIGWPRVEVMQRRIYAPIGHPDNPMGAWNE